MDSRVGIGGIWSDWIVKEERSGGVKNDRKNGKLVVL